MKTQLTIVLIGCVGLSACNAVGPNYAVPKLEIGSQFTESGDIKTNEQGQDHVAREWWKSFNDVTLDRLITDAQQENFDLRIAVDRVRQARSQLSVDEAASEISAGLSGSATRSMNSANVKQPGQNGTLFSTGGVPFDLYKTGFDAQWEVDLFGGIRRSNEAAAANYEAMVESGRNVLISLFAEVARNYIALRADQHQLTLAQKMVASFEDTHRLMQQRRDAGLADDADVARAETQLATARATLQPLQTDIKKSIHRLSVLLAKQPQELSELLSEPAEMPVAGATVEAGLPSELLRRRPDVRRAERDVARTTAEIGVATADLYPRFNLVAMVGLQSSDADNLFSSSSKTWSIVPGFKLPLFGRDKVRDNIAIRSAIQDQALLSYQSIVLAALEDVENALVEYHNAQSRVHDIEQAYAASQRTYEFSRNRYDGGLSSILDMLDNERKVLVIHSQLAMAEASSATSLVALYKALGGGWQSDITTKP